LLGKEFYRGREQSYVKHYVLEKYLERLAFKIGMSSSGATINYVDGFSGPWQHADEQLQDTSPFIAIEKLRKTRTNLADLKRDFTFRCMFIEKDAEAYEKLSAACTVIDAYIETKNGEFLGGHPKTGQWWSPQNRPQDKCSGQKFLLLRCGVNQRVVSYSD